MAKSYLIYAIVNERLIPSIDVNEPQAHHYQHPTADILQSSELGNKTIISYLHVQESKLGQQ